jgi:hypothetical protein
VPPFGNTSGAVLEQRINKLPNRTLNIVHGTSPSFRHDLEHITQGLPVQQWRFAAMVADVSTLLTASKQSFLRDQRIDFADVFDARSMSKRQRENHADETGQRFMIGTTCEKGGHRLRTKNGHCIQCDTSKIAHLLRFSEPALRHYGDSAFNSIEHQA